MDQPNECWGITFDPGHILTPNLNCWLYGKDYVTNNEMGFHSYECTNTKRCSDTLYCYNGGVCPVSGGTTCVCPDGYYGDECGKTFCDPSIFAIKTKDMGRKVLSFQ